VRCSAGTPVVVERGKRAEIRSLQKRPLEVKLKIGRRTNALGKETAQMLDRLEQRIGLRAAALDGTMAALRS
jgi:hypothetical protein